MPAFNKFYSFSEALAEAVHNLGSNQLALALTNVAPVATNALLADLTQISYTNLSSRNLTVSSSSQTLGVYKCVVNDITLTSTGGPTGPFRYFVIFNATAAGNPVIGWYDHGSSITLAAGESVVTDFDQVDGIVKYQ
jgi:hypothetical protein